MKKYKLLLINPLAKNMGIFSHHHIRREPSYQLYCIAAITPDIFDIEILDETIEPVNFDPGYDLVGITGIDMTCKRSYAIADQFRDIGATVVLGGIHASAYPNEALEHCDCVVIGEAEGIWTKLLDDFTGGSLKPKYQNSGYVDLTRLPMPRYDMIDREVYNIIPIQFTRGCPHLCNYCTVSIINGNKYRKKKISQIINELNYIKDLDLMDNKFIFFIDDNLYGDPEYLKKLVDQLLNYNNKFYWFSQITVNALFDKQLIQNLKKTGCYSLLVGFEALNLHQLEYYNKKVNINKDNREAINNCHNEGIFVIASFIIGSEHDDINTFKHIYNFVEDNNIFFPLFNILVPLGGTKIIEKLTKENRLFDTDWNKYNASNVTFIPKNLTVEELQEGFYWLYHRVFDLNNLYKRIKRSLKTGNWRFSFKPAKNDMSRVVLTLIKGYFFPFKLKRLLFAIKVLLLGLRKNVDLNTVGIILVSGLSSQLEYAHIPKPQKPEFFDNL